MIASRGGGTTSLKKAARNAPKRHYSRLYRANIVPLVAHPIQDMSEVSITHKTMGIRLPRLWCGAVGSRTKRPLTESNLLLPCSKNEKLPYPVFIHKVVIFKGRVLWHNRCAGR